MNQRSKVPASLPAIFTWLRFLFKRKPIEDLDEELAFHLERSTAAYVAEGMPPEQARRQATIDFGSVEFTREGTYQQRPGWLLETLQQDLRYALRGFNRNRSFTLTVIATLALAIGATTAVFSVVDPILFRSLPYADGARLVSIGLAQPLEKQEFMLGAFFYEWRDNQKPFTAMAAESTSPWPCALEETNPQQLNCISAQAGLLPLLGVSPVLGRNFLPEEDLPNGPSVAMITYALWKSHLGSNPAILNQAIKVDGGSVRVIGVLPKNFELPTLQPADVIMPLSLVAAKDQASQNGGVGQPMRVFARLKPGVSIAQARAEMDPIYRHTQQWIPEQFRNEFKLQIRSIRDRQMQDAYAAAWILLGAVLAVLLIACANVAGLFSARGVARQRELAVRAALGATRGRLIRQTLTESMLLSLVGAAAGFALAEIMLRLFVRIAPTGIPFLAKAHLDLRILGFATLLAVICALLFGFFLAMEQSKAPSLVADTNGLVSRARFRRGLVVFQIAISLVLLTSAGLLLQSFRNLERQSLGLEARHVLTVHVPLNWHRYPAGHPYMDFYLQAEAALKQLPGVSAIGMSNSLPPDGNSWHNGKRFGDIFVVGRPPTSPGIGGSVVERSVTPGYFRVLKIPIVQGPGFTEEERSSTEHFLILSKLLADQLFPRNDAIGQHIQFGSYHPYFVPDPTLYTVVGIAANVKNAGLAGQDDPELYELKSSRQPDAWDLHHVFLIDSELPASVLTPWIRSQIARLDPTAPVEIGSLSEDVDNLADRPRFEAALIGSFALTGLAMAIVGLYGVIAYLAAQRTREIGIRMALGADRRNILRLIATEGALLVVIGGTVGLASALALSHLLGSLLFNVGTHDPATFIAVPLVLTFIALSATLIPARKAMRVDPAIALRSE